METRQLRLVKRTEYRSLSFIVYLGNKPIRTAIGLDALVLYL